MDDNFKILAALKSDEELHNYVDNREKYLPESVEAAVAELQHRGVEFSDDELKVIAEDMKARRATSSVQSNSIGFFFDPEKVKQVEDEGAPAFFTKRAIYGFSVFFTLIFGSIMLAINVSKTKNRSGIIWIILYGLGFTVIISMLAQYFHLNSGFGIMLNILGTYPMNNFFWNKYIGNDRLYRVKPVWIPLIIGIALSALVLYIIFKYDPESFK